MVLPIRDFDGMSRLRSVLSAGDRLYLSRLLCERAVAAVNDTDLDLVVTTSSSEVRQWAKSQSIDVLSDKGTDLSEAVSGAIQSLGETPWLVVLPDLPLISAAALEMVAVAAAIRTVLVPSQDGGTNVIASRGDFPFHYGPSSFHRHLAARPDATVMSCRELSIDIDSPAHLAAFPNLSPA